MLCIHPDRQTLTCIHRHSALLSTPFIINSFVSAEIAQGILPNWRWGYGMFAILVRFMFHRTHSQSRFQVD